MCVAPRILRSRRPLLTPAPLTRRAMPEDDRQRLSAWEQLYRLAKTPKVCAGLSDAERADREMRRLLDAV